MTIFALNQILQNMSHLTKEQRFTIFVMKQQGFRNNQIANVIGKDKSVIRLKLPKAPADSTNVFDFHLFACAIVELAKQEYIHHYFLNKETRV